MASLKLICALALLVAVAAPLTAEAIDCSFVVGKVSGCIPYLRSETPKPTAACCGGVRELKSAANTTPDRRSVCECLKVASQSIQNIDLGLAGGLPKECNVNIPYKISPSTDCNSVQ